jgi:hypothetical protein
MTTSTKKNYKIQQKEKDIKNNEREIKNFKQKSATVAARLCLDKMATSPKKSPTVCVVRSSSCSNKTSTVPLVIKYLEHTHIHTHTHTHTTKKKNEVISHLKTKTKSQRSKKPAATTNNLGRLRQKILVS